MESIVDFKVFTYIYVVCFNFCPHRRPIIYYVKRGCKKHTLHFRLPVVCQIIYGIT